MRCLSDLLSGFFYVWMSYLLPGWQYPQHSSTHSSPPLPQSSESSPKRVGSSNSTFSACSVLTFCSKTSSFILGWSNDCEELATILAISFIFTNHCNVPTLGFVIGFLCFQRWGKEGEEGEHKCCVDHHPPHPGGVGWL